MKKTALLLLLLAPAATALAGVKQTNRKAMVTNPAPPPLGPHQDVRIDHGAMSEWSGNPQVYAEGDNVYVVWSDSRTGAKKDIYLNISRDRGETWLTEDIRIDEGLRVDNSSLPGEHWSDEPQITGNGANVYIVFTDSRTGGKRIWFNASADRGQTWIDGGAVQVDFGFSGTQYGVGVPQLVSRGQNVYVTWRAKRDGGLEDIFFNFSRDGGQTWEAQDQRIDVGSDSGPGEHESRDPVIACSNQNIYIAWTDTRTGSTDIYFNRSKGQGNAGTWRVEPERLDSGDLPDAEWSDFPRIAAKGNKVYVTYSDSRGQDNGVYFNRSLDGGDTWLASDIEISRAAPGIWSGYPEIAVAGNKVYVAYKSNPEDDEHDLYFNRSLDNGATWMDQDVRIDTGDAPGISWSGEHRIVAQGRFVCVVWADGRDGDHNIYCNRSTDSGATWVGTDSRLDTGKPAGDSYSGKPAMVATGSDVHCVWADGRGGGSHNIFYNKALGYFPYGAGSGARPFTLSGQNWPCTGEKIKLKMENVSMMGNPALLVSLNGRDEIPFCSGVILVKGPFSILPLRGRQPFSGGRQATLIGTREYSLNIPADPAFLGMRVFLQGFTRGGGMSLSNANELIIN